MRSASPWCGNATTVRRPPRDEAAELVLGLGEAARGDRGPLRLERERLPGRERVELDAPSSGRPGVELLLLPDLAYVDRLPDEVGAGGDRRHEVGRERSRRRGLVVGKSDVLEVEPPLGRGVDS